MAPNEPNVIAGEIKDELNSGLSGGETAGRNGHKEACHMFV